MAKELRTGAVTDFMSTQLVPGDGPPFCRRSEGSGRVIANISKKLPLGRPTPQDTKVATADIVPCLSDKTGKVPSLGGDLPFDSGDGPKVTIEDDTSNLAPRSAAMKPIQDPQHEDEAMAMKSGNLLLAHSWPRLFACQPSVHSSQTVQTNIEVRVHRQHDRKSGGRRAPGKPDPQTATRPRGWDVNGTVAIHPPHRCRKISQIKFEAS